MMTRLHSYTFLLFLTIVAAGQAAKAQLPAVPPSHIVILIEENYDYGHIIGPSAAVYAPYLNALTTDSFCAVFSQSYAIEHPSEPNYLDLFSGANQGTTGSDGVPSGYPFTTANMGAELIAAGKTFLTYSEDLPSVGFDGATYTSGGANYARKHNPCTNWVNTGTPGTNQFGPSINLPYKNYFPYASNYSSLPTVCYLVPNMTNDMHDGSWPTNITIGDTWFHNHVDSFKQWALCNNALLIITFDEDDDAHGNNIPTLFYGPMVKAAPTGTTYTQQFTHFNVLRTIEQWYGLGYAGIAADSSAITFCWRSATVNPCAKESVETVAGAGTSFQVMPNPASNEITLTSSAALSTAATVTVVDVMGRVAGKYSMTGSSLEINTADYTTGVYYYNVTAENGTVSADGKFIINHN